MRKTFRFFLALALCTLGAMNVNADEISLQEVPFWQHEVWGIDEPKAVEASFDWVVGESTGQPYGDNAVINFADLSMYSKLVVVATDGTPRFLFNRDVDEGQWADNEAESHLIDNTRGGWSAKYFSSAAGEEEGETVYTVDLKQMMKDKGFVHLHAIKGANWENVTVTSMVVVTQGKASQVGWTNLINNSNMEGDDVSSFFTKVNQGEPQPSEITDGVGVDGSRGIVVEATERASEAWDNQFWFRFNEPVSAGTKYRVSFDYRADAAATVSTQAHAEPSDYIHYEMFGNLSFTEDWQTFSAEGEVTAQQSTDEKKFLSVAFNLSELADANSYYFDNIKFEVFKSGTVLEFSEDAIFVDFGFDTNIPALVKEAGTMRKFFDTASASVKVNGKAAEIHSIEGCADGRLYIFMKEYLDENDEVWVSLDNNFGLTYTSGPNAGNEIPGFVDMIATYNSDVTDQNIYDQPYPYDYVTPTVMKADPEDGSFNLPSSTEFHLTFDKNVDCEAIVATANGQAMTVSPSSGFATEITLSGGLSDGECKILVSKIYPEMRIADEIYGEYEFTVNIGVVEIDPNDQPETLMANAFDNCAAGGIPDGFQVRFGEETRVPGESYGSGPRMFDFAAGGDFTKGLYFREGYAETVPGFELKAGKKYTISFNSAMWKDNGSTLDVKVLNYDEEEVFSQTVNNTPNVNGSTGVVSGSSYHEIDFVPEADGDYIFRWNADGWKEVVIANVVIDHQPDVPGYKEAVALQKALDAAKAVLEATSGDRYDGEAWNNLATAIRQYEGWSSTSPTAYQAAIDELNAAAQAMNDHRANCDEYDTQIKKAIDVIRQNEMPNGDPAQATKFVTTELFQQLKDIVAKYNGSSEWRDVADHSAEEAGVEVPAEWQLFYTYDELKDDAELVAAIAELKDIANLTSLLFTEGPSAPENANGGKGTGVAVLTERLRLGAESLKALGVSEDNPLLVSVKNALTDDDAIAENLQKALKKVVYNDLSKPARTLFQEVVDEETLESTTTPVDMTVFVKNPNTYKQLPNSDFTSENVPGWDTPEGYNRPGLTHGWGAYYNIEGVAEDCMFQTWGPSYRVEQTITDLPAGIYTVRFAFGERNNGDAGVFEDSYAYAVNSNGEEIQSSSKGFSSNDEEMFIAGIGQAFPFANNDSQVAIVEDIEVTDGTLTIGVNAGPNSHTFFNEVRVLMTAPLDGFVYEQITDGDVNMDGLTDVADISAILTAMAAGNVSDPLADVNIDNNADVADISTVLTIMASGSSRVKKAPATRADNEVTVLSAADVIPAEDGTFDLVINMDYETSEVLVGWNFSLTLPEGVDFNTTKTTAAARKKCCDFGELIDEDIASECLTIQERPAGGYLFNWIDQGDKTPLLGTKGRLISINLKADPASLTGTGKIFGIGLSNNKDQGFATFGGGATIVDVEFAINGGDSDGIQDIQAAGNKSAVYNLSGQRVNGQAKGLLIQDGKKFIVK